eukprot:scaffold9684_cov57-Phaeocystis_antarctica.AAC.2
MFDVLSRSAPSIDASELQADRTVLQVLVSIAVVVVVVVVVAPGGPHRAAVRIAIATLRRRAQGGGAVAVGCPDPDPDPDPNLTLAPTLTLTLTRWWRCGGTTRALPTAPHSSTSVPSSSAELMSSGEAPPDLAAYACAALDALSWRWGPAHLEV